MPDVRRITGLRIAGWRQFRSLDLDLEARLTVLTGGNGTGKTTLLKLLATSIGWPAQFVGEPIMDEQGDVTYSSGVRERFSPPHDRWIGNPPIGYVRYSDGREAPLMDDRGGNPVFSVQGLSPVHGLFFPSHRPGIRFQPVKSIPTLFPDTESIIATYTNQFRSESDGGNVGTLHHLKQTLMAAAMYGQEAEVLSANLRARSIWTGYQRVLRKVLPPELGFLRLAAEPPNLVIEARTGRFAIDAMSGGLAALMDLSWQIFMYSQTSEDEFMVFIDEPEGHLHPAMQRSVLPALINAFRLANFVVATHSPFVATCHREATVYALQYDDEGFVASRRLDFTNEAASADETLRRVLGLSNTLPLWAENQFNEIVERHMAVPPTPETLRSLYEELRASGLSTQLPTGIERIVDTALDDDRVEEDH